MMEFQTLAWCKNTNLKLNLEFDFYEYFVDPFM